MHVEKLSADQRQALGRWSTRIKTRAEKGKPGAMGRHIVVRVNALGQRQEFHPWKGWRKLA